MQNARIVHYATGQHTTACGRSGQQTARSVINWRLVTCQDCLAYRTNRRRIQTIGGTVAFSVLLLMVGIFGYAAIAGDGDGRKIAQAEIGQTIIAEGIQATLQSMSQTLEYPTRQAMPATQTVVAATTIPQTRHALTVSQTRAASQATQTARNAPAPYSIKVRGTEVVCREIAYEYVYMADLGKIAALQHVANAITLRSNNSTA